MSPYIAYRPWGGGGGGGGEEGVAALRTSNSSALGDRVDDVGSGVNAGRASCLVQVGRCEPPPWAQSGYQSAEDAMQNGLRDVSGV